MDDNSRKEHERLELQSTAINRMMHDDPVRTPINNPLRILEVGCGTGHTTNYLATKYPSAEIIGLDLSSVPRKPIRDGVKFVQGNILDLGPEAVANGIKPGSFDLVFSRMLLFGIPDLPAYIARVMELLAPGGCVELQEIDFHYRDGSGKLLSDAWPWLAEQDAAFRERGLDIYAAPKVASYLHNAGFESVQPTQFTWVYGKWPGHPETDMIGEYSVEYLPPANFEAYTKVLGHQKTREELERVRREMFEAYRWSEEGRGMGFF